VLQGDEEEYRRNKAGSTEEILLIFFSLMSEDLFITFSFFSCSNLPFQKKRITNDQDIPDSAHTWQSISFTGRVNTP